MDVSSLAFALGQVAQCTATNLEAVLGGFIDVSLLA